MLRNLGFVASLTLLAACATPPAGGQSASGPPGLQDLPAGAEQVTRTYWARPQDLPLGPYFRIQNEQISAVGFMILHDDLVNGEKMELLLDTIPGLSTAQRIDLSFSPGHEAMPQTHYDLTVYLVTR